MQSIGTMIFWGNYYGALLGQPGLDPGRAGHCVYSDGDWLLPGLDRNEQLSGPTQHAWPACRSRDNQMMNIVTTRQSAGLLHHPGFWRASARSRRWMASRWRSERMRSCGIAGESGCGKIDPAQSPAGHDQAAAEGGGRIGHLRLRRAVSVISSA